MVGGWGHGLADVDPCFVWGKDRLRLSGSGGELGAGGCVSVGVRCPEGTCDGDLKAAAVLVL